MHRLASVALVLALVTAACGGDDANDDNASPADETTTTSEAAEPTTTTTSTTTSTTTTTTSTTTTTEPPLAWREVAAEDCVCADGSPYRYWVRQGDPERVMVFFQGGGACFTAETCDPATATYTTQADVDPNERDGGVFDLDNPDNPVSDWSMVFMPYCTGDIHLGTNAGQDYGNGVVVNHTGFINASKSLDEMATSFPDAERILVTGSSAGAIPAPLVAGLIAESYPDADIMGFADAAGGYPTNPLLNTFVGAAWGTAGAIPEWGSTEEVPPEEYGVPNAIVFAGLEYPQIRFARFDDAFDEVQTFFSELLPIEDPSVRTVLDINETLVEDAGIDLPVYIAPGSAHTILGTDRMYDLEVEGVGFLGWLTDFIAGETIDDVVCTDCGEPAA